MAEPFETAKGSVPGCCWLAEEKPCDVGMVNGSGSGAPIMLLGAGKLLFELFETANGMDGETPMDGMLEAVVVGKPLFWPATENGSDEEIPLIAESAMDVGSNPELGPAPPACG